MSKECENEVKETEDAVSTDQKGEKSGDLDQKHQLCLEVWARIVVSIRFSNQAMLLTLDLGILKKQEPNDCYF